ncbi:MAG TPA: GNAT family N-acetyltransferase, partial [Nitrospira sp.]
IFCPIPQGRDSLVSVVEGNIAAVAIVRQKFLLGDYLELLGVADRARGKGIGKELLAHIESQVFARTKNLFACVSDFNSGARAFYKKQGYQEIGPMPNFLIPGSAEILLRKTLGPARERKA